MKKALIISRQDDRTEYDTSDSLAKSLNSVSQSLSYDPCFLEDLSIAFDGKDLLITNERNGQSIQNYEMVFLIGWFKEKVFEEMALSCAIAASSFGIQFRNGEALHNRSKSKISQYVYCAVNNMSMTKFCYSMDNTVLLKAFERSKIEFPLILKSPFASRGADNYLVQDMVELKEILDKNSDKTFLIQDYIPNDGDLRLTVLGDRVGLAISRRAKSGTHLNNTSQGGAAELVELEDLPKSMVEEAVKISKLLNREITGIDMIVDNNSGDYYFLEANNMPQLSTGSFVDIKAKVLNDYFEEMVST